MASGYFNIKKRSSATQRMVETNEKLTNNSNVVIELKQERQASWAVKMKNSFSQMPREIRFGLIIMSRLPNAGLPARILYSHLSALSTGVLP